MTKKQALKSLKDGGSITTGMLKYLGLSFETWLRYAQVDKDKQHKMEQWAIYKLEPTLENANNVK